MSINSLLSLKSLNVARKVLQNLWSPLLFRNSAAAFPSMLSRNTATRIIPRAPTPTEVSQVQLSYIQYFMDFHKNSTLLFSKAINCSIVLNVYRCSSPSVCWRDSAQAEWSSPWWWSSRCTEQPHRTAVSPQGFQLIEQTRHYYTEHTVRLIITIRDVMRFVSALPMLVSCWNISDDMRFPHTADDWKMRKNIPKYWFTISWPFLFSFSACIFPLMVRYVHLADQSGEPPKPRIADVAIRLGLQMWHVLLKPLYNLFIKHISLSLFYLKGMQTFTLS